MEKETSKVLKKMGFPVQEIVSSPTGCITKVQGCLVRRLKLLDDCILEVQNAEKAEQAKGKSVTTIQKILD